MSIFEIMPNKKYLNCNMYTWTKKMKSKIYFMSMSLSYNLYFLDARSLLNPKDLKRSELLFIMNHTTFKMHYSPLKMCMVFNSWPNFQVIHTCVYIYSKLGLYYLYNVTFQMNLGGREGNM